MYNRYIPQPDGSYRRSRMPSPPVTPSGGSAPAPPTLSSCGEPAPVCPSRQQSSAISFLRQLLPKNLDTGDLLILVLLLLMSADCEEEKNTALLTLALYLFL